MAVADKDLRKLFEEARKSLLSRAVAVAPIKERRKLAIAGETQIIKLQKATEDTVIMAMAHHCAQREAKGAKK